MNRIVMHYDMDAFYASIEIRDNPQLGGKPVIVGTKVVTTCSYEARKFGLHSAMSVKEARKLCPRGIYLPCDKDKYAKVAYEIQNLVIKMSDKVEFVAFDEAYIDITELCEKYINLEYIAKKFRERIYEKVKLTCSVGIGYNKLSAKIASEVNKPNGFFIINNEEEFISYIKNKDIRKIPGIGKKTEILLNNYGIFRVNDLYDKSLIELQGLFGHSRGIQLYENARGIDNSLVSNERQHKSIGNETTLNSPIRNEEFVREAIKKIFDGVYERLKDKKFYAKTLTIKIRFSNREVTQKSRSLKDFSKNYNDFYRVLVELLDEMDLDKEIILYGFTFSNLQENINEQLSFDNVEKFKKNNKILLLQEKIKEMEKKNL